MARPPERSWNGNLTEGSTDGRLKKMAPDRGGFVESTSVNDRRQLWDVLYGYVESPQRILPDGTERELRGADRVPSLTYHQR